MSLRVAGVVVLGLLAGCTSGITGRSGGPPPSYGQSPTPVTGLVEGRATLAMPFVVPGSSTCLVPLSIERRDSFWRDNDPFSSGGWASQRRAVPSVTDGSVRTTPSPISVRWHNVAFIDTRTGEQWLLVSERGVISAMLLGGRWVDGKFITTTIVFLATHEDTDADGMLTDRDAAVAIATDADGRNPRVISPPGTQVWNMRYEPEVNRVFLYLAMPDIAGEYSWVRSPAPYVFAPSEPGGRAHPLVSASLLSHAEGMLGRPVVQDSAAGP
jgi:hypothetical protein